MGNFGYGPNNLQNPTPYTYGLTRYAAPSVEPVTLVEAKAQCRQEETDDDTQITNLIVAAREYCEVFLNRRLVTQTWDMTLDGFPNKIKVPYPRLQSVSSITYIDTNGVTQTLAISVYAVDVSREPGEIYLKYNQYWPITQPIQAAVTVRYVAGYGAAAAVPQSIKQAMLMLIGHWYENREDVIIGPPPARMQMAVEDLLWTHKVWEAAG